MLPGLLEPAKGRAVKVVVSLSRSEVSCIISHASITIGKAIWSSFYFVGTFWGPQPLYKHGAIDAAQKDAVGIHTLDGPSILFS